MGFAVHRHACGQLCAAMAGAGSRKSPHENQTLNSMAEGVATSGFPRTTLRSSALVVDTVAMAAAGAFRVVLHVVRKAPRLLHANSGKTFIAEVERLQILREVWQAKGAPHFVCVSVPAFCCFFGCCPNREGLILRPNSRL